MDRHLDHARGRQLVAEHHQHLADRRPARLRRLGHLADHQLAFAGTVARVRRNQQFGEYAAVVRHHGADTGAFAVTTDHARDAPFEHLDDRAFAPTAMIDIGDAGQHAVTMQGLAHFARRQEQVVAALFRFQETETFRVGDHDAGDQVELFGHGEAAAPVHQQLAVAQHGVEPARQGVQPVGRGQLQRAGDLLDRQRTGRIGQESDQGFATDDRILVALRFARGVRIGSVPRLAGGACLAGFAARAGGFAAAFFVFPGRTLAGGLVVATGAELDGIGQPGWPGTAAGLFLRGFLHARMVHRRPERTRLAGGSAGWKLTNAAPIFRLRGSFAHGGRLAQVAELVDALVSGTSG